MRDYGLEFEKRTAFIRERLAESRCEGIVFGNSGEEGQRARRHTLQGRVREHSRSYHALREQAQLRHG